MNTQAAMSNLNWAMETLPFPTLFLYLIAFGLLWLYIEALLTRSARATPKWRRPFPVVPAVSEVVAWLIRGSSWLLWTWAILYFVLVFLHWSAGLPGFETAGAADALTGLANTWRQTYVVVVGILPPAVVQLMPGI